MSLPDVVVLGLDDSRNLTTIDDEFELPAIAPSDPNYASAPTTY